MAVAKVDAIIKYIDDNDDNPQDTKMDDDFDESNREVLPLNVRPIHYFLSYTNIDLEKDFKFNGEVKIDLNILEDNVDKIIINSEDIEYKSINITQNNNTQNIDITTISENKKSQQITIPLTTNLNTGTAQLYITFIGILNDNLKGFYRSKYKLGSGVDAFCGCTQFEACDARLAFPCWDEPAAKATFQVQIEYPSSLICLSNMPFISDKLVDNNDKLKCILFDKTPKMSTYLLAWIIGEFEYIEAKTNRDILMRIYTPTGNKDQAKYALKVAVKCLDFYEKYFEINYPLPKCDMIALTDFAAGAMENWGLITYREVRLLCDESTVALRTKQDIARVICHELAHQWFGNLVTMDWWSQLWLNEGFASFMQYLSADTIEPDLNIWSLYMIKEYKFAFKLDGMVSSHPIEVPVLTAAGADEVFDIISYCKGSCVITMLQSFLGDNVFKNGLKNYLNKFKYSNAVTNDLWNYLSKESGKNVKSIMMNWTRKQGFPLIECKIIDKNAGKLQLKQSRFLLSSDPSNVDNTIWNVPIVLKIDNKLVRILLTKKTEIFTIPEVINSKYVHLNANSKGFYCTHYDSNMLTQLLSNLNNISDLERICIIRDLQALSKAGNQYSDDATEHLLNLLLASSNETSNIVWDELITVAKSINHIINNDVNIQNKYNSIMCDILTPVYNYLNKWGDNDDQKQQNNRERNDVFRPLIISSMAKYGNKDVINQILNKFKLFIIDKNVKNITIPDALRSTIYEYSLKNGGDTEYNALKDYYLSCTDSMDKRRALQCLGCTCNNDLISSTLNWIKDSNDVRKQDKIFGLSACSQSQNGRNITWEFLQKTLTEWNTIYGGGGFILNAILKLPSNFVSNDKANEIETFYNTLTDNFTTCKKSMKQCVESIRLNAEWRNKQIGNIQKWINKNYTK